MWERFVTGGKRRASASGARRAEIKPVSPSTARFEQLRSRASAINAA
jgi:hypothetical protein